MLSMDFDITIMNCCLINLSICNLIRKRFEHSRANFPCLNTSYFYRILSVAQGIAFSSLTRGAGLTSAKYSLFNVTFPYFGGHVRTVGYTRNSNRFLLLGASSSAETQALRIYLLLFTFNSSIYIWKVTTLREAMCPTVQQYLLSILDQLTDNACKWSSVSWKTLSIEYPLFISSKDTGK